MGVAIQDFLTNRRNRLVGSILGTAERTFFQRLSKGEQDAFRAHVRDAVGSYHDSVLDLLRADGAERNDEVVTLLRRLERRMPVESSNVRPNPADDPVTSQAATTRGESRQCRR